MSSSSDKKPGVLGRFLSQRGMISRKVSFFIA